MGSLAALARRPMSPARARLVEAAKGARYGLKDLSIMLGRNHSYLQQYVVKGSPRVLPEEARHRLADILGVNEAELRETGEVPARASVLSGGAAATAVATVAALRRVPVLVENGTAEPGAPAWPLAAMVDDAGDQAVAVTLTEAHGVFQPRMVLLCDPATPPRAGELAVFLHESRILSIGLVLPSARGTIAMLAADPTEGQAQFQATEGRLWRVLAVRAT